MSFVVCRFRCLRRLLAAERYVIFSAISFFSFLFCRRVEYLQYENTSEKKQKCQSSLSRRRRRRNVIWFLLFGSAAEIRNWITYGTKDIPFIFSVWFTSFSNSLPSPSPHLPHHLAVFCGPAGIWRARYSSSVLDVSRYKPEPHQLPRPKNTFRRNSKIFYVTSAVGARACAFTKSPIILRFHLAQAKLFHVLPKMYNPHDLANVHAFGVCVSVSVCVRRNDSEFRLKVLRSFLRDFHLGEFRSLVFFLFWRVFTAWCCCV